MAKKSPGLFDRFKGLWNRGPVDDTPLDHFSASENNCYDNAGVRTRDGSTLVDSTTSIVRELLYKPNPPFTGTNVPRTLYLRADGNLYDSNFPSTAIFGNIDMRDFALVNFFGRAYISPSDGRVGLEAQFINVYDGTGPGGLRTAAGLAATPALSANLHLPLGSGVLGIGTYLISYAFETSSGFITQAAPFVAIDTFGSSSIDITNLPLGPATTAARWIIATQAIGLRADLTQPFDVTTANFYPQYFAQRIADNTTTSLSLSFYDENLVESADYLQTLLPAIPAGVGLIDYKGRMVSYGEFANPSLTRVSEIGEPESFSSTSGFLITDPADSTGVRCATEFRNILYFYKQQRGYMTQDNGDSPSTWEVVNFEKSRGTEQYGIAALLDAKGSSSEGYLMASRSAMVYFNGVFVEPELSYKIRDLWMRINEPNFYKMQLANDSINKRIYALVPLNDLDENGNITLERTTCSHIIVGDYRDGLDPMNIKWDLWEFGNPPVSIVIYNKFVNNVPSLVTRLASNHSVVTLNVGIAGNDAGVAIDSWFQLAPLRWSTGISQYDNVRIRATGPCRLAMTAYGQDETESYELVELSIPVANPGREFNQLMNLVSEQCRLKVRCAVLDQRYKINSIQIEGQALWSDRAR